MVMILDRQMPTYVDRDDAPISGGVQKVLGRGYAAQLAGLNIDADLMGASPERIREISQHYDIPVGIVERRARALDGYVKYLISKDRRASNGND